VNSNTKNSIPELQFAWAKYRAYALTSRKLKKDLERGRLLVLMLSLLGAIFATACQSIGHIPNLGVVATLLGYASAICLGGATFFGKELVKPELEKSWIRARARAEAIKSQVFLFITHAKPYDTKDSASVLHNTVNDLIGDTKDIVTLTLTAEQENKGILPSSLSIEDYVKVRLQDQINYYKDAKAINVNRMLRIRNWGLILGSVAVILGAVGSSGWSAGWVAVISTALTSIVAYAYAGRYQYLIISYQSTADRLEYLKAGRNNLGDNFVTLCEQAMSTENSSWMAKAIEDNTTSNAQPS